jgi:L-arabinose isomerase
MHIERRKPLTARVGVMGVGHDTYWGQFPGLLDTLRGHLATFETMVEGFGVEVVSFGMVDNPEVAGAKAEQIAASGLDLLFVDMVTYATSGTFGVICRRLDVPIVLVALQPDAALDYDQANTYRQLVNDPICACPEFVGVAERLGTPIPPVVIGRLEGDEAAREEIESWCRVARVLHDLTRARIGQMGHVLEAMLDMHTDPTLLTAQLGCHVVQCEADELVALYDRVCEEDVARRRREILAFFDTPDPKSDPLTRKLTEEDLSVAARVAEALDRFVRHRKLDALAYYYEGQEGSLTRKVVTNLIVGNSMLTGAGFPMCGELDLKTCVAMMIMDRLEVGGSFAELHPIDFNEGFVLVGHDGPHHLNVAQGKPVLRSLTKYHGKPGSGASVEFKLREGPITMLSISQTRGGKLKFVVGEGQSVAGAIPPTGNTNTRGYFQPDVVTFLRRWLALGPTHHFALGIGHRAREIRRVAWSLGIQCHVVETS